jgi:signal transduction histidine kinase
MGLALALRSLVEEFAERNSWRLEIDIPQQIDNLPAEVEHSFYRIAQEALENVVRHANAQVLRVKLKKKDQKLTLTIADDGKGFEPRVISEEQLGLRGMRERAELIGARLYVESQPSQGTTLTLEVELDR